MTNAEFLLFSDINYEKLNFIKRMRAAEIDFQISLMSKKTRENLDAQQKY